MRIRTLAITIALLCTGIAYYIARKPDQKAALPVTRPASSDASAAILDKAEPQTPTAKPVNTTATPVDLDQIAALIGADGDDLPALEKLYSDPPWHSAAEIIATVKTRSFPERERGIYYALGDAFAALATRADIAALADTYRAMPRGPARDDVASLLRHITRRDLSPSLAAIIAEGTKQGIDEPALLAAATHAFAFMAAIPEAELLLQTTAKATPSQLSAMKDGLRALRNRTTAPLLIAIAVGDHTLAAHPATREVATALLGQVPDEKGRDALESLANSQTSSLAQTAADSLQTLKQTHPALFKR